MVACVLSVGDECRETQQYFKAPVTIIYSDITIKHDRYRIERNYRLYDVIVAIISDT